MDLANRPRSHQSGRISDIMEGKSADEQSRGWVKSIDGTSRAGDKKIRREMGTKSVQDIDASNVRQREVGQGSSNDEERPNTANAIQSYNIKRPRDKRLGSQEEVQHASDTNTQLISFL